MDRWRKRKIKRIVVFWSTDQVTGGELSEERPAKVRGSLKGARLIKVQAGPFSCDALRDRM